MRRRRALGRVAYRLSHPHTTVRWRLTLIYGGLFLVCGAGLLAITYGLVAHAPLSPEIRGIVVSRPGGLGLPGPGVANFSSVPGASVRSANSNFQRRLSGHRQAVARPPGVIQKILGTKAGRAAFRVVLSNQRISDLHQLEVESAIALAIMALISGLLGWVVAGRVLRPLRTITSATQEISEASLHRRLALAGPRDELRQLADTIDGLLMRLEGAFEAQRRFVANASHELRTPLTTVRALLEMVLSDPRATLDTFRETSRQVLEENEQEERLIDALLTLAQGQRGLEHPQEVDLSALSRDVARAQSPRASARGVNLDTSVDPATISGDPRLVERLVSNLVENAVRYNVEHGSVSVAVGTQNGHAVLHVANTGPVVPSDQVERLLQPFQRLGQERVGQDGLGLGLSIVSAIALAHQATLDIKPQAEGGLDVVVRFPAEQGAPAAA